jgi:hypothetical protein
MDSAFFRPEPGNGSVSRQIRAMNPGSDRRVMAFDDA